MAFTFIFLKHIEIHMFCGLSVYLTFGIKVTFKEMNHSKEEPHDTETFYHGSFHFQPSVEEISNFVL